MKLLSYGLDHRMEPRLAFSLNGQAIDVMRASLWMKEERDARDYLNLASSMKLVLQDWGRSITLLKQLEEVFQHIDVQNLKVFDRSVALPESDISFFAPIPDPSSIRLFQAFDKTQGDAFSFGNTQTLLGHDQALNQGFLAYQPEIAAILGSGSNGIQIAGYTIVNNWVDMTVNDNGRTSAQGLAMGQATSFGPYLVTVDEIDLLKIGNGFNMDFHIRRDASIEKEGHFKGMECSFQSMIQASMKTLPQPGDIYCSGSPLSKNDIPTLHEASTIEIEVQGLGTLITPVR